MSINGTMETEQRVFPGTGKRQWDSSLYLAYTWESGVIRNGRSGGGVTVIWNKLF